MKNQVIIEKALSCGFVNKAKKYGILCHKTTNCLYDKQPFEVHLEMVYNIACEFSHLLKTGNMVKCCLAAAWTHDVINPYFENGFDAKPSYSKCKGCDFKSSCEKAMKFASCETITFA